MTPNHMQEKNEIFQIFFEDFTLNFWNETNFWKCEDVKKIGNCEP